MTVTATPAPSATTKTTMWIGKSFTSDFTIENDYIAYDQQRSCKLFDDFNHYNDKWCQNWKMNQHSVRDSALETWSNINFGIIWNQMWLNGMLTTCLWVCVVIIGNGDFNPIWMIVNYMKNYFLIFRPSRNFIQSDKTFGIVCALVSFLSTFDKLKVA